MVKRPNASRRLGTHRLSCTWNNVCAHFHYVSDENNTKDDIRLQKNAVSIMIGTSLGGIALGIGIGILSYILLIRIRRRRQRSPSQNYFASQHFSSTKPYKAPSIVPSTITPSSPSSTVPLQQPPPLPAFQPASSISNSSESSRTYSSDSTLMHPSRVSRTTDVLLEPLRPNRQSRPLPRPTTASSEAGSAQEYFQLDTKRPPLPDDVPSSVPSSSNTRPPPSHSRSPTYVQNPHSAFNLHETEVIDVPPEYGRHTDDTSCTPSIISSGRVPVRF